MNKDRIRHRGARVGDLRHYVIIHDRSIIPPAFGTVDFEMGFESIEAWAAIKTVSGKTIFDGVGQDINVTHEFMVRYDADISVEKFIMTEDGRRFRILMVEDYEERHEYMRLLCRERGYDEAAKA